MNEEQILLHEIRQITEQYKIEVPGKRKIWPNSVRQRALQLNSLGMRWRAISMHTGLPYFMVLSWRSAVEFREVATVIVPTSTKDSSQIPRTVTVTTSSGLRLEGISFEQGVHILERFR